ncbi:MAG: bifunctional [glutamate--ammonia ligase]-adenylyl-L-tyrosine phosphorylase/[glutamate--ammonia-ligase] adenylyltransferase [Hyphomonadaceae bacterium]|nr:bifunctional [glutamate--ammonia ligase]-adenylyl-L-tyrosine phosphorylase/[glutamate--ammonia-ligase] adenylyltransferase [Hyphomonadaceae bacterium]OUX95846.1 MAG: bifunctional glutamine synthetase adenylyltransferase/deadenyltransferase [Hyphomonas sp. TMED17]
MGWPDITALAATPIDALKAGAEQAPYLGRLCRKFGGILEDRTAEQAFETALEWLDQIDSADAEADVMSKLRDAKGLAHAAIAALDLSQSDTPFQTTERITRFADASVEVALRCALRSLECSKAGIFLIALGKMGAFELNYSSDIDIVAFFDPDIFEGGPRGQEDAANRVIQMVMRLLEKQTADGYVFRTDLRLRPDPNSTPVAMSTQRAEIYYTTLGQNWERMVWIKARPVAGDLEAATGFIKRLEPFVWRPQLDYWAIADVHAIKNMINTKVAGRRLQANNDVKLGPGGIREIEFFAQTQQIILGGRLPSLRASKTLSALDDLVRHDVVAAEVNADLQRAYPFLRGVEHRIQMLGDQQTHSLPTDPDERARVAALCGFASVTELDEAVRFVRETVHAHYANLFVDESRKRQAATEGNLVFTGVDPDPGTVDTLLDLGFVDPENVILQVSRWHRGRMPATRSSRGRELLTALLPDAIRAMGKTGQADAALMQFSRFLEGLSSGVQTLSMLLAEPKLLEDLVATLALAPQIGAGLAKRPSVLEALVSENVRRRRPDIDLEAGFEGAMDQVRQWHSEESFLIGHRLLHGELAVDGAGEAWSRLAETCIELMAAAAEAETVRRFGPPPGVWSIAAMGKLGGREMTAGSDLDLIVIYDRGEHDEAQAWFTRFTQRLIAALSADTAKGYLYEVDMRLRPSGRAGPVATSIEAFERYHFNDAWTWEIMALTRLRPVVGDVSLKARIINIANAAIVRCAENPSLDRDILDMRRRLLREKPPAGDWDIKHRLGGLIDIEFIVQQALLKSGRPDVLRTSIGDAIGSLTQTGAFSASEGSRLGDAALRLQAVQQVQRLAFGTQPNLGPSSHGLREHFRAATGARSIETLDADLEKICGHVVQIRRNRIGDPTAG